MGMSIPSGCSMYLRYAMGMSIPSGCSMYLRYAMGMSIPSGFSMYVKRETSYLHDGIAVCSGAGADV